MPDQTADHKTKSPRPDATWAAAEAVLAAVAGGSQSSFELAAEMVMSVLEEPLVRMAVALDALLKAKSPFALVRAVELAEHLLTGVEARGQVSSGP